jgi:outer membrane protein
MVCTIRHTLKLLTLAAMIGGAMRVPTAAAQQPATRRVTLEEALRIAINASEAVAVARAGETRATGQRIQVRSQLMPQVSGTAGYTKTLKSQFEGLSFGGGSDTAVGPPPPPALCAPTIAAGATAAERNAALAQAITCPASGGDGGGFDFTSTGFGARNQWSVGLQFSQNVYSGGRIGAQTTAAAAQERSAAIDVASQRAQVALDVTQAYFDAVLADRLVSVADSSLAQAEEILTQTKLAREVGNQSEFDLLRAQVTRDNQRPVVIQARSARQIAYLRLKQLLDMPFDQPLDLSTPLPSDPSQARIVATDLPVGGATPDTSAGDRAPVRQLEAAVEAQEGLVKVARADRLPSVSIVSGYQRLYFPSSLFPSLGDARQNWTIGVSTNVSLFNGGRFRGDEMVALANLDETKQRLKQTRELAQLDSRIAMSQLEQAEAAWAASQGTAEQAQRAYGIDQIRYREGISTQTDLAQSRLLLEQATVNRAQAARDLAVARVRLQLLRDLPLQLGGASGANTQRQQQQQPQQPQTQQRAPQSGPPGSFVP